MNNISKINNQSFPYHYAANDNNYHYKIRNHNISTKLFNSFIIAATCKVCANFPKKFIQKSKTAQRVERHVPHRCLANTSYTYQYILKVYSADILCIYMYSYCGHGLTDASDRGLHLLWRIKHTNDLYEISKWKRNYIL